MSRALAGAYVEPQAAAAAYSRYAAAYGADKATDALRHDPEQFGILAVVERERAFGLWISVDDKPARTAAAEAASLTREWAEHRRHAREALGLEPNASADAVRRGLTALRASTAELTARLSRELPAHDAARALPSPAKEIGRTVTAITSDRGLDREL